MAIINTILTVSKYESKTLLRSWFFRIFSILALVFIFFFNLGTQSKVGFPSDDMVALPSKVPFLNLYIINITQAIIAVFLASDFLKRDKKLDTTEVIYMRSMSNADYVLGKTLGNLWVFFLLNVVALIMVAVFNLISPYSHFSLMPYFYYFFLLSVPTLVYILGLSFLLMSLLKNQAITFVLLLGYIAATLFYFQNQYHYLFDYMAFRLPVTHSEFVGFGNLKEILIHRGIYLFLGLAFIGFTILLLKRLSQSRLLHWIVAVLSVALLLGGLFLGAVYVQQINHKVDHRAAMLALNDAFATKPFVSLKSCDIEFEHLGDEMKCTANVSVCNETDTLVDELIFTLNPSLRLTTVEGGDVVQELQLVRIKPPHPLSSGESLSLKFVYHGTIDESLGFLDLSEDRRKELLDKVNTTVDKRHAFLAPDYVLLTSEVFWYPTPGISYGSKGLGWLKTDFTQFSLSVKTTPGLQAISQGAKEEVSPGEFVFTPETPLTKLSLAIGNYEMRAVQVDSIDYQLIYLKGHNYFDDYFTVLGDTIEPVIRDLKENWETKSMLSYPFRRFTLVEVPVQFYSYAHVWTNATAMVQPEMVFLAEGGYQVSGANFAISKRFQERRSERNNESETPREKEENFFRGFVNQGLLSQERGRSFGMQIRFGGPQFEDNPVNPYFIFPNYYNFCNVFNSKSYPITNRVVEAYLIESSTQTGSGFLRNLMGVSGDEKGNMALQKKSFKEILSQQDDKDIVDNVIETKSAYLFSLMKGAAGVETFDSFLYSFLDSNRFRQTQVSELNLAMKDHFDVDLFDYLPNWYESVDLPGYILNGVEANNVVDGDRTKTMVQLELTNTEAEPGVVLLSFRLRGQGRGRRFGGPGGGADDEVEQVVSIGAHETKRISLLLTNAPRVMRINTFASKNIPAILEYRFDEIEESDRLKPVEEELVVAYNDGALPNEIIVDNEDPGFHVEQPENSSLLLKLFKPKPKDDDLRYKGMIFWNPPVDWTLTTRTEFYGKQIRSAFYTKSGDGDRKAVWTLPIQDGGYYQVYAYVPRVRINWRGDRDDTKGEYIYSVYHDDGKDEAVVDLKASSGDWVELGSYYFSPDSVRIELSNQSEHEIVYADAVKLVQEK